MTKFLKELKLFFVRDKFDFYFLIYSIILVLFLSIISSTLGFWSDEGFTLIVSQRSIIDIIDFTINDTNPPLYYVLIKLWGIIFGYSEFTIRFFSIISLFFSLFVLKNILLKTKLNFKVNLNWILLPISVAPVLIYFSVEARFYAFVAFLFLAFLNFGVGFDQNTNIKNLIFLSLFAILGLYTHSIFVIIIFSFSILLALKILTKYINFFQKNGFDNLAPTLINDKFMIKFIVYNLSVLIFYLPWLFVIVGATRTISESFWLQFDPIMSLLDFLQASIIAENYISDIRISIIFRVILLTLVGLMFVFGVVNLIRINNQKLNLILLVSIVSLVCAYFLSFSSPVFYFRYLSFLTPIIFLIIYFGIEQFSTLFDTKYQKLIVTILIILISVSNLTWFYYAIYQNPRYKISSKELTNVILDSFNPQTDLLVTDSLSNYTNTKYYLQESETGVDIKFYDPNKEEPIWTGTGILKDDEYISKDQILSSQQIWVTYSWGGGRVEKLLNENGYQKIDDKSQDYQILRIWKKI
jgi:hypothetical protein